MTTVILKILIIFMSSAMIFLSNPVKLSMWLLATSLAVFFLMTTVSGGVWFPLIFSLIFMGGILMMFMILSSILPNENSVKMKIFPLILTTVITMSIFLQKSEESFMSNDLLKSMSGMAPTMAALLMMLMLYFFSMITILCKEEMPMRMTTCCSESLIL